MSMTNSLRLVLTHVDLVDRLWYDRWRVLQQA